MEATAFGGHSSDSVFRPAGTPLGALEAEQASPPAIYVIDVPELLPNSVDQLASYPEQQAEPPRDPAPGLTVGPAASSGPDVMEAVPASGAEDWPKPRCQRLSRSHCRWWSEPGFSFDLEDTSALGVLEAEQACPPALEVIEVREQLPNLVDQLASKPSNTLNHLKTPPKLQLWGLLNLQGLM